MHQDEVNELRHRFDYHPPSTSNVIEDHEDSRRDAFDFAFLGAQRIPANAGREKAFFLTKVEEALFWLNAGIARGSAGHTDDEKAREE